MLNIFFEAALEALFCCYYNQLNRMEIPDFQKTEQEPENLPDNIQQQPIQTNQSKDIVSEYLPDYLRILEINSLQHHQKHRESVYAALREGGLAFDECAGKDLKFKLIEFTKNYEYLLLNVSYNNFLFHISILNINDESPIHKVKKCHSGNFSTVYQILYEKKNIAVKCNRYSNKSFQLIFRNTLLEYLSFQIITQLKSGPKMPKAFGFDLLIYKDCIEFSMEFCRRQLEAGPRLGKDLKLALRNLHSLKMIHSDIKPENICFSKEYNRYVFIDMGLHRVITEEIGQNTFSGFQGSLLYCSQEMRLCFLNGPQMVDLYYHDAICLEESLKEIKQKPQIESEFENRDTEFIQPNVLMAVEMKFILIRINQFKEDDQYLKQHFFYKIKLCNALELDNIYKFIANLNYSLRLERITNEIENFSKQYNKTSMKLHYYSFQKILSSQSNEQIFEVKLKFIMKLNQRNSDKLENLQLHKDKLKESIDLLNDVQKVKKWESKLYYRIFAELMQINSWKIDLATKQKLCNTFNKIFLSIENFEQLPILQKKKRCFQHICVFIRNETVVDNYLCEIIKRSLLSIILLEIYNQEDLLLFFKEMVSSRYSLQTQIRLFLNIMTCLSWMFYLYKPPYSSYYLSKRVCEVMYSKLPKIIEAQDNRQEMLIKMVTIIIQPEGEKLRKSYLKEMITYLEEKMNCRVMKFYNAVSPQEQLLAQIYVYLLRAGTEGAYYKNTFELASFQKLLSLQAYKQQQQLCILQFYQIIVLGQFQLDEQLRKKFSQKYQEISQYFTGLKLLFRDEEYQKFNFYQIHRYHITFKLIDYSQYSELNALAVQNNIFSKYTHLIDLIDHNTKGVHFSLNEASVRANLNLKVISQAVLQVRRIIPYQIGNDHAVTHQYMRICQTLTYYYYIMFQKKFQIDVEDIQFLVILKEMKLIVETLSCDECKINCHFAFYIFYKFNLTTTIGIQDQLQLFHLSLWLIKSHQINSSIVVVLLEKLCRYSGQLVYEKLLLNYLISNKISLTTYFRNLFQPQIEEDYQKTIIALFWRERYVGTQLGKPYYLLLIHAFYKELLVSKYEKNYYIAQFSAFIQKFMIEQGYLEFLNFHQQYLQDHYDELNGQWELALYFGSILLPLYDKQQLVQNFYYCFVWRHYHKFSLMSKEIISTCIYRSFLCNEVMHRKLLSSPKRHRYLLKLDYKNRSGESEQTRLFLTNITSQLHKFRAKVGKNDLKFKLIKQKFKKFYKEYCIQLIDKSKKRLWRKKIKAIQQSQS